MGALYSYSYPHATLGCASERQAEVGKLPGRAILWVIGQGSVGPRLTPYSMW